MATFLESLFEITTVTGVSKALRCQKAEHDWADTPCGIMDQYISAMGKDGNLLLIDCRSNEYKLVSFGLDGGPSQPVLIVTNSNVKHTLSGSEYPDRVRQCKEAVSILQKQFPQVKALRDANENMLDACRDELSSLSYLRAKHVITEDIRTLRTVEHLASGDFPSIGKEMTCSHISLRDDFEVSCPELDTLVNLALEVPGVHGSRMTGGGFGGCTVTLLEPEAVAAFQSEVGMKYREAYGIDCTFYPAVPSAGAQRLY
jgi:galactokinase